MAKHPTILTEDQIIQVESLACTLTIDQIAEYFGICRTTFKEIRKRQPEIYDRYKKGKNRVISDVGNSLIQKAIKGDSTAQMFFLKTQGRWKESSITIKKAQLDKLNNKERLELIIQSIMDSPDGEIDTKVLASLDKFIKTKTELDELQDIKERLQRLESKG